MIKLAINDSHSELDKLHALSYLNQQREQDLEYAPVVSLAQRSSKVNELLTTDFVRNRVVSDNMLSVFYQNHLIISVVMIKFTIMD